MKPQLPIKHTSWTGQEDGQGKIGGKYRGGGNFAVQNLLAIWAFFLLFQA